MCGSQFTSSSNMTPKYLMLGKRCVATTILRHPEPPNWQKNWWLCWQKKIPHSTRFTLLLVSWTQRTWCNHLATHDCVRSVLHTGQNWQHFIWQSCPTGKFWELYCCSWFVVT